jgi:hypothetical protein
MSHFGTTTVYKCPHCGKEVAAQRCRGGKIPQHDFPQIFEECPGSNQQPRALHDHRPLWKDMTPELEAKMATMFNTEKPMAPDGLPDPAPTPEPAKPPRQRRKRATAPEPATTNGKTDGRLVRNTELIAMYDAWDAMADFPVAVQRRIVNWLESQVSLNEQSEASKNDVN